MDTSAIKAEIIKNLDSRLSRLKELSLKIHDNPELGFQETKAADWLAAYLVENGFKVERGVCGIPTSFKAVYGKGKPSIGFLAEYDALPGIGHGCGHNIICACAAGAGVASKLAVDKLGGSVQVIGTPGEEGWGGKIIMSAKGAFSDIDAAMLVHPEMYDVATMQFLACQTIDVEFFGKSAHAAASPELGINALEAMLLSFSSINALRQHIRTTARIHGIITDGGKAANIVPEHSAGTFMVRAMENSYLDELKEKVINCFAGAALQTGARLEYKWGDVRYDSMNSNLPLARLFVDNMKSLGRNIVMSESEEGFGSSDMGNVSQVVPAIHPTVAIANKGTLLHSAEFAKAAASDAGMKGMLDAAKAMALTAVDLLAEPETLARVKRDFEQGK